jgi:hypothetical protein
MTFDRDVNKGGFDAFFRDEGILVDNAIVTALGILFAIKNVSEQSITMIDQGRALRLLIC